MPYVDLLSSDDYASIWYTTNSQYGNVGSFDPDKPTVVLLHPMFLDSTWLEYQFGDTRLNSAFNMIAFDMRVCGKSFSRPSGLHDSWVEAADLAFLFYSLHLPPAHILALERPSTNCALRFAALFPELCLTLTLCNVPPPTELRWAFTAYDEVLQSWCFAGDLQAFEHALMEATALIVGPGCDPDLQDDLVAYWETEMPPRRRPRVVEAMNVLMNRTPMTPKALAAITQPVLIVQGERSDTCPLKYAEQLVKSLVNAQGGAILYQVKGASGCLNIVPSSASIVNQVFVKFVSRSDPPGRSDIRPPPVPVKDRMRLALTTLAEFLGDHTIALRDPSSSLSFSCVAPRVRQSQADALKFYGQNLANAFSPLRPDGRPVRKYSDRTEDHWFHAERDGISYAGTPAQQSSQSTSGNKPTRDVELAERLDPTVVPELIPLRNFSARKMIFKGGTVDNKVIIKGSVKLLENPDTISLKHILV